MDEEELKDVWNAYCEETLPMDVYCVFQMSDFNEMFEGAMPHTIARMICDGDFRYDHKFFTSDKDGNLISSNHVYDIIDVNGLKNYVNEEEDSFGSPALEYILDQGGKDSDDWF